MASAILQTPFLYCSKFVVFKFEAVAGIYSEGEEGQGDLGDHTGVIVLDKCVIASDIDNGTEHHILLRKPAPVTRGGQLPVFVRN